MSRLNRNQEKVATQELLAILAEYPDGLPTKVLVGTERFHGEHTLSPAQIARMLRATHIVNEEHIRRGMYTQI